MIERRSEVLPERCIPSGIICREQQSEHVQQPEGAGGTNKHAERQRQTDGHLAVSHQKRDRRRMAQHKTAKQGNHERVRAVFYKFVDPELKSAVQRELRSKYLVLPKN